MAASYFYLTMTDYEDARVTGVVDGRTLDVTLRTGKAVRVRLAGLESPSSRASDERDARAYLTTLVEGEQIDILEYGYDAATFGALTEIEARVVTKSGRSDVAEAMLTAGMAAFATTRHVGYIERCEYGHSAEKAKRERRGLWGRQDREQRPN